MLTTIKSPLHQDAFELDPASQAALRLTDEVNWSFAILFGRCGGKQVPIACDADGVLAGSSAPPGDAELLGQLTGDDTENSPLYSGGSALAAIVSGMSAYCYSIDHHLESGSEGKGIADYFDATIATSPLFQDGDSIAYYLALIESHLAAAASGATPLHVTVDP